MEPAQNIHSFKGMIKGLRKPSRRDAVKFGDFLTNLPTAPLIDIAPNYNYPMDGNDSFGDCVVANADHALQVISGLLTGTQNNFTEAQIVEFYKTQNPNFDPNGSIETNGPGSTSDNGMDIQIFLEYLVAHKYILGFASIDWTNETELRAAIYIGLSLICGVVLDQAQMSQEQFGAGKWDNVPNSPVDGGHGIPLVGYLPNPDEYTCVTWAKLVQCTQSFIKSQMNECWFILTQAHIDHPNFRDNFDLAGFKQAVAEITNNKIQINMNPTLKKGSVSDAVETLQTDLNKVLGCHLSTDGIFGNLTEQEVVAFQESKNLEMDGIVGVHTWSALLNALNQPPAQPVLSPDPLFNAIMEVESGGKDNAEGDLMLKDHAYGCLQIRQGVCDDVNAKFGTKYLSSQCLGNRQVSQAIWNYYWRIFPQMVTDQDKAFSWNGGPGWKQFYNVIGYEKYTANLNTYWERVQKYLPSGN